jgi:hypothetical protein
MMSEQSEPVRRDWWRPRGHRTRRAAALLATASLIALLTDMPKAAAEDCAGAAAPPANIATPSMLSDTLRAHTTAELLAIGFLRKPVEEECAWIYEVKVLTASGSVVELDFDADGLGLIGARGPDNDRDAAALVKGFGGDAAVLTTGANKSGSNSKSSGTAASSGKGSGGDNSGGDDGGEGGSSGSGSGSSGSGGSGSGGGGSGDSGTGGGDGGDGGGDHDGGEGGGDGGGEGGDD